jgi:hypothetical protein
MFVVDDQLWAVIAYGAVGACLTVAVVDLQFAEVA